MAVLTIYNTPVFTGGIGTVTYEAADQLTMSVGAIQQNYYGSFTYSDGFVASGVVVATNLWDPDNGGWQYGLTGLNHDAVSVAAYVTTGDTYGLQTFLFNGDDTLFGADGGNDNLIGYGGANLIYGFGGNDTLYGGLDVYSDLLIGGKGDDLYEVTNGITVVYENAGEGTDTIRAYVSGVTLPDNVENLLLGATAQIGIGNELPNLMVGNAGDNLLKSMGGNDTLQGGNGLDTLDGGIGNDTMQGGDGDDTYVVDIAGDVVIELASQGTDLVQSAVTYTLGADVENLTLTGAAVINGTGNSLGNLIIGNTAVNELRGDIGNDTLSGGLGNDSVYGGSENDSMLGGLDNDFLVGGTGNDTLDGGPGTDVMLGSAGDDTYLSDSATDTIAENALEGTDIVLAFGTTGTYTLANNVEHLTMLGASAINSIGNNLVNVITGNSAANDLRGQDGADTLIGGGSNDTLFGGNDNDRLDGGTGNDQMFGNFGDDTYVVDSSSDVVAESAGQGTDTVLSSVTYTLANNVENLTLTGAGVINGMGSAVNNYIVGNSLTNDIRGLDGADTLDGGGGDDTIFGGTGNDSISGGTGADLMLGNAGDDIYIVDNIGDSIGEAIGEGIDTVFSVVSYTLAPNIENLVLTSSFNVFGKGNSLDNSITGNAGANEMRADAGNDTLIGGAGNDSLFGGIDNDSLSGGDNTDSMFGGAGTDTLDGGTGADQMFGDAGDDTYFVDNAGDLLAEGVGAGFDQVFSSVTYTLQNNFENLNLLGSGNINGNGSAQANVITGNSGANDLRGFDGADTLDGAGGNDTLFGGALNDSLVGGSGADLMLGQTGDDTYVIDDAGDVVAEALGEGVDLVFSTLSYTLPNHVDNLTLTGATNINAVGNALSNVLTGNSGNNIVNGLVGVDTLIGGAGNDTLAWDATDGSVQGGLDTDTLRVDGSGVTLNLTGISDALITDIETINMTGTGNNTLTLALSDVLAISSTTDTLTVDGNAGDSVNLQGAWTTSVGDGYTAYDQGLATVLINTDITVAFF